MATRKHCAKCGRFMSTKTFWSRCRDCFNSSHSDINKEIKSMRDYRIHTFDGD